MRGKLLTLVMILFSLSYCGKEASSSTPGSRGYRPTEDSTSQTNIPSRKGVRKPNRIATPESYASPEGTISIRPNGYKYRYPDCAESVILKWKNQQLQNLISSGVPESLIDKARVDKIFTLENFPRELSELIDGYCDNATADIANALKINPKAFDDILQGRPLSEGEALVLKR